MPPRKAQSIAIPDNDDKSDGPSKPRWDTSPQAKPAYLLALRRWLPYQNSHFKQLVENYTVSDKANVYTVSVNHTDRLLRNSYPQGTFERPAILDASTIVVTAFDPGTSTPSACTAH